MGKDGEIDPYSDIPVYRQAAEILRGMIASGELEPHRPIPSKKTAVQRWGIAGTTYDKATALLKAEGLIRTVPGKGLYVVPPEERG